MRPDVFALVLSGAPTPCATPNNEMTETGMATTEPDKPPSVMFDAPAIFVAARTHVGFGVSPEVQK